MPHIDSAAVILPASLNSFVASPSELRVSGGASRILVQADVDPLTGAVSNRDARVVASSAWRWVPQTTSLDIIGIPANNPALQDMAFLGAYVTNVAGSTLTITWTGTTLLAKLTRSSNQGTFTVVTDGGSTSMIDGYLAGAPAYGVLTPLASDLVYGQHTTVITVTGNKGGAGASSDALVTIGGFDILSTTDAALKYVNGTAYPAGVPTTVSTVGTMAALTSIGSAPYRRDLVVLDRGATAPRVIQGTAGSTADTLAQFQTKNKVAFRVEAEDTTGKLANLWYTKATPTGNGTQMSIGDINSSGDTSNADYCIIGFIGTGIDVLVPTGAGFGVFAASVDGGTETTVDQYNALPNTVRRFNLAYSLPYGYHQIKLRKTGTKNASSTGYACTLDAFDVYHPIAPATPADSIALAEVDVTPSNGWIRYDDAAGWVYAGANWSVSNTGGFINEYTGGLRRRNDNISTTDTATFTFTGTKFRLLMNSSSLSGRLNVSVDGGSDISVDCYSESVGLGPVVVYTSGNLTAGVHTVTLKTTNTKNASSTSTKFDLDSIEVLPLPVQVRDVRNLAPVDTHTEANRAVVDHVLKYHTGAGQVGMNSNTVNTTSTTFTDLTAFDSAITGRTPGTVDVSFVGVISNTSANVIATLQLVNATTGEVGLTLDFTTHSTATRTTSVKLQRAFSVPEGASHLFRLQAKTTSGTLTVQGTMFTESKR